MAKRQGKNAFPPSHNIFDNTRSATFTVSPVHPSPFTVYIMVVVRHLQLSLLILTILPSLPAAFTSHPFTSVHYALRPLAAGSSSIEGCFIKPSSDPSRYDINIDGKQADIGKFSRAIYKNIAKQARESNQQIKGFRPGTIPPHLISRYRSYCMEQTARETIREGFDQRGYEVVDLAEGEEDFRWAGVSFVLAEKKKKSKKRKKNNAADGSDTSSDESNAPPPPPPPIECADFDDAVSRGWEPGLDYSFSAEFVKVQRKEGQPDGLSSTAGDSAAVLDAITGGGDAVDVKVEQAEEARTLKLDTMLGQTNYDE